MSDRADTSAPGGLFIVSAPSGGGKTSLSRALVPRLAEQGIDAVISVSHTTRQPRPGESDGVHYHFVGDEQFRGMIAGGEFLEHAEVFGRRYGTGRAATEALLTRGTDVILDIDWQGARQVRQRMAAAVSIFILPPSAAELHRRLSSRGQDSVATIAERMAEAHAEMTHSNEYDYLIVNEDFERALADLAAIFQAQRLRRALQERRHAGLIADLLASK